jgi:hypothetical protein
MPPVSEVSLLPSFSEVFHGFLNDRTIVNVVPLPVRMPRRESGLDPRRKACMVRFHITVTARVICPFKLRLPGTAPPGGEG